MSLGKVIKSLSDKRTYKAIALKNQIQCLIISDNDAQKSAAALSVGVGSLLDPFEAQGIAHYLEHMLFMGTSKYPEEN
jgi:secreted Zn-dependent insulinase-like peptidase